MRALGSNMNEEHAPTTPHITPHHSSTLGPRPAINLSRPNSDGAKRHKAAATEMKAKMRSNNNSLADFQIALALLRRPPADGSMR